MPVLKTDNADNGSDTYNCDDATDIAIKVQANNVDKATIDAAGAVKCVTVTGMVEATGVKLGATSGKIAFLGATPQARPVLATGSTTDQLITALQTYGLFSQS
jgi:hypothetical protein